MKLSDEVQNVSAEAVIAVSKVTEDFLNQIVAQAHEVSQANNRKTIKVIHICIYIYIYVHVYIQI
jgi:histone H3/H4